MAEAEVPPFWELDYLHDFTLYQHPPCLFTLWYLGLLANTIYPIIKDLICGEGGEDKGKEDGEGGEGQDDADGGAAEADEDEGAADDADAADDGDEKADEEEGEEEGEGEEEA